MQYILNCLSELLVTLQIVLKLLQWDNSFLKFQEFLINNQTLQIHLNCFDLEPKIPLK